MRAAISPYDLGAGALAAYAGLLVADSAVTLVPSPDADSDADPLAAASLAERVRARWDWSAPLWEDGLLAAEDPTAPSPAAFAADALDELIARDPADHLGRLVRERYADAPGSYFEAVCRDLVRGGGDPAVTVPITVAMERFAAGSGRALITGEHRSVTAEIERRSSRPTVRIAVPTLAAGGGHRLLLVRQRLAGELGALRAALAETAAIEDAGGNADDIADFTKSALEPAAAAYHDAFAEARAELFATPTDDDARAEAAMVQLSPQRRPADASLRSADIAASLISRRPAQRPRHAARATPEPPEPALAPRGPLTLHVKRLPWDA